jgi:hypothetical protein
LNLVPLFVLPLALGLFPALAPPIVSSQSDPLQSCSAECDRKASECVDACEAQHSEAKPRVECKVACIAEREKCEKDCK